MKKFGKIKVMAVAALSALALSVPIVLAQTPGTTQDKTATSGERGAHRGQGRKWRGHGKGHGGMRGGMMFKGLNLTDDQKAKMKQIGAGFKESTKSTRAELRSKRQALRQAEQGGTFDEALATQKLTETAGLQAKLMAEQFKMRQQMLAVLTPEQKTQLEQQRAEFKAKWAERRGRKSE